MTDIERLLRACQTGYGCRALISWKSLRRIDDWGPIAESILQLGEIHPRARECWLDVWLSGVFSRFNDPTLRPVLDFDLLIDLMRKVLPLYWGGDVVLYRGQLEDDPVGMSWSWRPYTAFQFAQTSVRDGNRFWAPGRRGTIMLRAFVPASEIISAPCINGKGKDQEEFVIDPRHLEIEWLPSIQAGAWIGYDEMRRLRQLGEDGDLEAAAIFMQGHLEGLDESESALG
jgi:hypothetical protein